MKSLLSQVSVSLKLEEFCILPFLPLTVCPCRWNLLQRALPAHPAGRPPGHTRRQEPRPHLPRPGAHVMNVMPIDNHGDVEPSLLRQLFFLQVPSLELVRDLRWVNPRGQEIPQDDRWPSTQHPPYWNFLLHLLLAWIPLCKYLDQHSQLCTALVSSSRTPYKACRPLQI